MALKHKFQQTYFDEYYLAVLKDKQDFFYETMGKVVSYVGCAVTLSAYQKLLMYIQVMYVIMFIYFLL